MSKLRSQVGKQAVALLLAGCAGLAAVSACSSSSDERQRAIQLAGGCLINSDCDQDLICAFGRCHKSCDEDRDCDHELRCVKSEETGAFVCQLPDETVCKSDEHCPDGQVCAVDLECRDSCKIDDDCVDTQVCAASGECASTDSEKADALDEDGNIILESPSNGGTNGTGGAGGAEGAGASGAGGSGGTGALPSGGAAGEPSALGGSGNEAGAPPDSEVDFEETPGPETVDNGTREKAVPIRAAAHLYLVDGDEDWLSYQVSDDGRAHVITLTVQQDAAVSASLSVLSGIDFTPIGSASLGQGTLRQIYFTVASGTTTFLHFSNPINTSEGMLRMTVEDAAESDEHEPNNRWQDASEIAVGQTVSAQALVPYLKQNDHPSQDWFEITLAQGTATLELLSVPEAGRLQVIRRDPQGAQETLGTTVAGATDSFDTNVAAAGTYWVQVVPYAASMKSYENYVKPAYFSQQYSFRITQ